MWTLFLMHSTNIFFYFTCYFNTRIWFYIKPSRCFLSAFQSNIIYLFITFLNIAILSPPFGMTRSEFDLECIQYHFPLVFFFSQRPWQKLIMQIFLWGPDLFAHRLCIHWALMAFTRRFLINSGSDWSTLMAFESLPVSLLVSGSSG